MVVWVENTFFFFLNDTTKYIIMETAKKEDVSTEWGGDNSDYESCDAHEEANQQSQSQPQTG